MSMKGMCNINTNEILLNKSTIGGDKTVSDPHTDEKQQFNGNNQVFINLCTLRSKNSKFTCPSQKKNMVQK